MAVFVDSAVLDEVREALETGFVTGVTTNPILIAQAGRPAEDIIKDLCELTSGPVFYQLTSPRVDEQEAEARYFAAISPGQVVLKIPCTYEMLRLTARISAEIPCAVTAIFSIPQTVLALEAGARYVIPYVNRATRALGDGLELVRRMAATVAATGSRAEILAASLKTPEETASAILAGASHVTVPLAIIKAMAEHEQTALAVKDFAEASRKKQ